MVLASQNRLKTNHRLTPEEVINDLLADQIIERQAATNFLHNIAQREYAEQHALEIVAEAKLRNLKTPDNYLTLEDLTLWLAHRVGLEYLRIDPLKIDASNISDLVSVAYAKWNRILPIHVTAERAIFATSEPYLTHWIDEIRPVLKCDILRVVANPVDIERYRKEFFSVSRSIKGATLESNESGLGGINNLEALVELGKSGNLDANDSHIIHIVDWLLQYAHDQRASDIHLEPRRELANIRFRIDGIMHQVYQIPNKVMTAVISRIKIVGRMDVAEKRRPQDGRVKTRTKDGRELDMRLSTMPTAFGEKLVTRIFNPDVLLKDFSALGFSAEDMRRWQEMVKQPHGIILVTGPTGSGKTTTLYSTLKNLATPFVNVCTVEDPIEMVEPTFNQMQVQPNIGLDFANGIRTLMRQDPDIIMIGEIRDHETAEMAIQAALTGHLVLSTLHTNDAASAITRLLDIGVPHYLIKATVIGIVAQRLVRTLCTICRGRKATDLSLWDPLTKPWNLPIPNSLAIPKGCVECRNTGYRGRIGIYEILLLDLELRNLIQPNFDDTKLRQLAYQKGLHPLRISAAMKILTGETSLEEVLHIVPLATE